MLGHTILTTKDNELFSAVENNNPQLIRSILLAGGNPLVINAQGETPFIYAINEKSWSCAKEFVKYLKKEHLTGYGLNLAIENNQTHLAGLLIQQGDQLEEYYSAGTGHYPLHKAVVKKEYGLVQNLLESKANPSIKTELTKDNAEAKSSLQLAVETNQPSMVRLLLSAKSDQSIKNSDGLTPIAYAAKHSYWGCVKVFLESFVEKPEALISSYEFALKNAVDDNQDSLVELLAQLLVEKNASLSKSYSVNTGFYALHRAIQQKNIAIVSTLLENKVDPSLKTQLTKENPQASTPIQLAITYNTPQILRLLLNAGANQNLKINPEEDLPVIYAANLNYWQCVKELIHHPKNTLTPKTYESILLTSINADKCELAKSLINLKATFDSIRFIKSGYYALHMAIEKNNSRIVNDLLEAKADPLIKTEISHENPIPLTAVELAFKKGNKEIINLLMNKNDLKKQILDECLASVDSIYTAFTGIKKCLEEYLFDKQDITQYLKANAKKEQYDLLILALFIKFSQKHDWLDIFKNFHREHQQLLTQTMLESIAKAVASNINGSNCLPKEIITALSFYENNNEKTNVTFTSPEWFKLITLKNKWQISLDRGTKNLKSIYFDNHLLFQITAINFIQNKLVHDEYYPKTIKDEIHAIFGERILQSGWFSRNPLDEIIDNINYAINKGRWSKNICKTFDMPEVKIPMNNPLTSLPTTTKNLLTHLNQPIQPTAPLLESLDSLNTPKVYASDVSHPPAINPERQESLMYPVIHSGEHEHASHSSEVATVFSQPSNVPSFLEPSLELSLEPGAPQPLVLASQSVVTENLTKPATPIAQPLTTPAAITDNSVILFNKNLNPKKQNLTTEALPALTPLTLS